MKNKLQRILKTRLTWLLTTIALLCVSQATFAAKGFFTIGAWAMYYNDGTDRWSNSGDKDGTIDIGVVSTFSLKGSWAKTWSNDSWTVSNVKMEYSIGSSKGDWIVYSYTGIEGGQYWEQKGWNCNVINAAPNKVGQNTLVLKYTLDSYTSMTNYVNFTIPGINSLSANSLSFDETTVGSESASKTVTFKMYGSTFSLATSSLTDFTVVSTSAASSSGGQGSVTVKFKPTSAGTKNETLTLTDSYGKTATITLSGTGKVACTGPTVTTTAAEVTGTTTATLGGSYVVGDATPTEVGIEWVSGAGVTAGDLVTASSVSTPFSVNVTGLTANSTYKYKAYAKACGGTKYYGAEQTFTTYKEAPANLYIKGPMVNNGVWTDDYRTNWASVTSYTHSGNVYTYKINASNAPGDYNQPGQFCVSTSTGENKIHNDMDATRTGWAFEDNTEGNNFIADCTNIVTSTSSPITLTITFNQSTGKYTMTIEKDCTNPTSGFTDVSAVYNNNETPWKDTFANDHRSAVLSTTLTGLQYQWYGCDADGNNETTTPTNVTLTNATTASCTATFDLPGTYYFKLKAGCTEASVSSTVLTVNVPYPEIGVNGPFIHKKDGDWDCHSYAAEEGKLTRNGLVWSKDYTVVDATGEFTIIQRYKNGCTEVPTDHCDGSQAAYAGWDGYLECGNPESATSNNKIVWDNPSLTNIERISNNYKATNLSLSAEDVVNIKVTMSSYNSYTVEMTTQCVKPSITAETLDAASYCNGTAAGSVAELSVTAKGTDRTYQWYSYTNAAGTEGEQSITGATNATYKPSTADDGTLYYRCKVTACEKTVASSVSGAITIAPLPGTITISGDDTQCKTATGVQYTASADAVPGSAYSYSWSVTGTGWELTSGASDATASFTVGKEAGTLSVTPTLTTSGTACVAAAATQKQVTVKGVALTVEPSAITANPYQPYELNAKCEGVTWATSTGTKGYLLNADGTVYVAGTSAELVILKPAESGTATASITSDGCTSNAVVTVTVQNDSQNCNQ